MAETVVRPIWRRFKRKYFERAAAHVRRGGFAAIVPMTGPIEVIVGVDEHGKITELAEWALLCIDHRRWRRVTDGPAKGLIRARIRPEFEGAVLDFCERDSIHEGSTRELELDCLACGACCHDADVRIGEKDFARWNEAGRAELGGDAYVVRAEDGHVSLRFVKEKPKNNPCQHLGEGNACAIYAIRPDSCRDFVMGSEACLAAREETLGLRDGADPC